MIMPPILVTSAGWGETLLLLPFATSLPKGVGCRALTGMRLVSRILAGMPRIRQAMAVGNTSKLGHEGEARGFLKAPHDV